MNRDLLSPSDKDWLEKHYPSLHYDGYRITGYLPFSMSYSDKDGSYTVSPPVSDALDKSLTYHSDGYEIRIEKLGEELTPLSYEVGNKIATSSIQHKTSLHDMHVNQSGDFCLAAPQELNAEFSSDFSIKVYLERFVIPFLFLQTHFQKTGDWAWSTAAHGLAGILEWYQKQTIMPDYKARQLTIQYATAYKNSIEVDGLLKRLKRGTYKGHMPCLCGEKHKIRNCNKTAQYAINALRHELISMLSSI